MLGGGSLPAPQPSLGWAHRAPLGVQGSSQLAQRRVYLVLHHILKELASKRLAADQRNFEQARIGRGPRWYRARGPRPWPAADRKHKG